LQGHILSKGVELALRTELAPSQSHASSLMMNSCVLILEKRRRSNDKHKWNVGVGSGAMSIDMFWV
jgi:hypothetical protein